MPSLVKIADGFSYSYGPDFSASARKSMPLKEKKSYNSWDFKAVLGNYRNEIKRNIFSFKFFYILQNL